MKKLINSYRFHRQYYLSGHSSYTDTCLEACYPKRSYHTKMTMDDLPDYYCSVHRYDDTFDVFNARDVKDLCYTWCEENHFMKDSALRISYTGKMEKYQDSFMFEGRKIVSCFPSYTNVDGMVFGNSIFKFLAYVHKYSEYDLSNIRNEFISQCEWLKENEPLYVPDLDTFNDYGEWFDDKIKIENYDYKRINKRS